MLLAQPDGSPRLHSSPAIKTVVTAAQKSVRAAGLDPVSDPVEARYQWAHEMAESGVRGGCGHTVTISDRLDAVLTHRIWGWVAFAAVLGLMFSASSPSRNTRWIGSMPSWTGWAATSPL